MAQMSLPMKQSRLTDIGDRFVIAKVDGVGESVGVCG